eukprot:1177910-Prorocentrum_minimum.AAC.5
MLMPHSNSGEECSIEKDAIMKVAREHWLKQLKEGESAPKFSEDVVQKVYKKELGGGNEPPLQRVVVLEISQYLENYLWPHFNAEESSFEHIVSIMAMVNEKFREGVPPWACFHTKEELFPSLMSKIIALKKEHDFTLYEKVVYLLFIIHCFQAYLATSLHHRTIPWDKCGRPVRP